MNLTEHMEKNLKDSHSYPVLIHPSKMEGYPNVNKASKENKLEWHRSNWEFFQPLQNWAEKVITNKQPTACTQMSLCEGNTEGDGKEEVRIY